MKTDELVDYLTSSQKKHFWEYSLSYYWAHIARVAKYILGRSRCFFGDHRIYDGIFHTRIITITRGGDYIRTIEDVYKCYHCRYCNKPADQELHDERID
jgi:hypothetical protein